MKNRAAIILTYLFVSLAGLVVLDYYSESNSQKSHPSAEVTDLTELETNTSIQSDFNFDCFSASLSNETATCSLLNNLCITEHQKLQICAAQADEPIFIILQRLII